jgi:uncharacterized integral membrane protein
MQKPWLILIAIIVGWIMFLIGNEGMIQIDGKLMVFMPSQWAWMLNIYGMALFVMGLLILNKWCETRLKYRHKLSIA